MLRPRLSAATICIVAAAVASLTGSIAGGALAKGPFPPPPPETQVQIDIELAFDATASMRPSIERARRDGVSIVEGVVDAFPDTRYAVTSFRDYGNPSGEYQVLQSMTEDHLAVQAAFAKLRPASNPSPLNSSAEEYNLALQKSYTDPEIGWRAGARKVVVVIGDAEPHGARTSGLTACGDTSVDSHGLDTAEVLAGMRAAGRTLVMIRQISPETTVSLQCYAAMAERAYPGGAARDGGADDLAKPILALIESALAPVTLRPDVGVALPGGSVGYTATVSNPNSFALSMRSVAVALPAGFRPRSDSSTGAVSSSAGGLTKVSTQVEGVIRPSEKVSVHFSASAPKRRGRYAAEAVVQLQLPGGHVIASTGRASLRITPRPGSLLVAARAQRPVKQFGATFLRGGVRIGFRPGAPSLRAGVLRAGRLVLGRGPGRSLTLRVRSFRIVAFGSPTVVRLKLEVERVRGFTSCSPGAAGIATLIDNQRFNATGLRRDTVVTTFGVNCRVASGRWVNLGGAARSAVAVTAK